MKSVFLFVFMGLFPATILGQTPSLSASSEQRELPASAAMDGKMDTRWSSSASDNQWLQIDFNSPIELVGLKIFWESAYARDYEIQTLDKDGKWQNASKIEFGDGGVDEIYFGLRKTKAIKFIGHKRGTGWGYSILEIQTLGKEMQIQATATSSAENTNPQNVLDGNFKTFWKSSDNESDLELTFPHNFETGGLQINWGQKNFPSCKIKAMLADSNQWQTIMNKKAGINNVENLFFPAINVKMIRISFDSAPVCVSDIQIKSASEAWTPVRHFEMLAQRLPMGLFPNWIYRQQGFWTITGLPESSDESLLDEFGSVESGQRIFSVVPALYIDGKIFTSRNFELSQSLVDDWVPIPTVKWHRNDFEMNITANTIEPDATVVLYSLKNGAKTERNVSLMLAARPLQINPPWQFGGFSSIKQAGWQFNENTLKLNEMASISFYPKPDFASIYNQKANTESIDIIEYLTDKKTDGNSVTSQQGIISAGARYDFRLAAGERKSILVVYPNKEIPNLKIAENFEEFFNNHLTQSLKSWQHLIGDWDINVPDKRLINIVRSNLAYLIINADGPATQPGSRNYSNSWIRDGSISSTAMMRFGMIDFGKRYLQWFTNLIQDDGFVPFLVEKKTGKPVGYASTWAEHDSFGQYAFLVRQVTEMTDDNQVAEQCWQKLISSMKYMENLRKQRLTEKYNETEYYGILPESNSHEGYFPPKHSYWDDFFALRGLADAQAIALRLGYNDDAALLAEFEKDLRKSLLDSIDKVRRRDNLKTLPGCAELGDSDPTSTSVAFMVADERDNIPADAVNATYDKYMNDCRKRASDPPGKRSGYTPYEARNIGALIRLGRYQDARMLLNFLLQDAVRPAAWNEMAEVVHGDLRTPSYIGDMPHTWAAAELINSIRDMFVYEDRGKLVIAAAVPEEWLEKGISVRNLRTLWGTVSYNAKIENGKLLINLKCSKRPPNGFTVPNGAELIILEQ
ncbi:MAG: discoidin domain-containing protein [Phycisphaerales bacterium]